MNLGLLGLGGLFKTQAQEIAEIQQERDKAMANYCPNPYQQYANQQSPAGPLVGGGNGLGGYIPQAYPTVSLPNITGSRIMISFTDARGLNFTIEVDQAYAGILTQISHNHAYYMPQQAMATGYIPPIKASPPPKMLDGDFTEDEMTQAEEIIQEMGGNGQATHQAA